MLMVVCPLQRWSLPEMVATTSSRRPSGSAPSSSSSRVSIPLDAKTMAALDEEVSHRREAELRKIRQDRSRALEDKYKTSLDQRMQVKRRDEEAHPDIVVI